MDGLIIVDLPTEEADLLLPYSTANGLDFIRLIAPTTDDERLPHVLNGSSGFVYYVSITGVTGTVTASVGAPAGGDPAHQEGDGPADSDRVRGAHAAAGRFGVPDRRWGSGGVGADRHAVGASGCAGQGAAGGGGGGAGSGARVGGGGAEAEGFVDGLSGSVVNPFRPEMWQSRCVTPDSPSC